jgi:hypothetical protein
MGVPPMLVAQARRKFISRCADAPCLLIFFDTAFAEHGRGRPCHKSLFLFDHRGDSGSIVFFFDHNIAIDAFAVFDFSFERGAIEFNGDGIAVEFHFPA